MYAHTYIFIQAFHQYLQLRKRRLERLRGLSPAQSTQSSQANSPSVEVPTAVVPEQEESGERGDHSQHPKVDPTMEHMQTGNLAHRVPVETREDRISIVKDEELSMDTLDSLPERVREEFVPTSSLSPFQSLESGNESLDCSQPSVKVSVTRTSGGTASSLVPLMEKVLRVKVQVCMRFSVKELLCTYICTYICNCVYVHTYVCVYGYWR